MTTAGDGSSRDRKPKDHSNPRKPISPKRIAQKRSRDNFTELGHHQD